MKIEITKDQQTLLLNILQEMNVRVKDYHIAAELIKRIADGKEG